MRRLSPIEDGKIDRAAFTEQLREATECAIAYAATMVRQRMPPIRRYLIPVDSGGYPPECLEADEQIYPEDDLLSGQTLGPLALEEAVAWLWRAGKVPVWIDVSAYAVDRRYTYVRLMPADRFSGQEQRLYHQQTSELPPFGIKSPDLPLGWSSVEAHGRFHLPGQWQGRLQRWLIRKFWRSAFLASAPLTEW